MPEQRLLSSPRAPRADSVCFELNTLSLAIDKALLKRASGAALISMAALGLAASPGLVRAATITVDSTADDLNSGDGNCTLREAIRNANNNTQTSADCVAGDVGFDTVDLSTISGTIILTNGDIGISDEVAVIGPGSASLTIDADNTGDDQGESRHFYVSGTAGAVSIAGTTLVNGYSAFDGGAIYADDCNLTLSDIVASNNESDSDGGAVSCYGGLGLTVTNSTFSDNYAVYGGAVYAESYVGAAIQISGSTFYNNVADNDGGAVYLYAPSGADPIVMTVADSLFSGNSAGNNGGGLFLYTAQETGTTTVALTNNVFTDNYGGNRGGGAYVYLDLDNEPPEIASFNATLTGNQFQDNSADNGGGLYLKVGPDDGAGVVTLAGGTFSANQADYGGGIYLDLGVDATYGSAQVSFSDITVSANSAIEEGGGLKVDLDSSTTFTLENSTLSGNSANIGGGIYLSGPATGATATLRHTTIANNSATSGQAGVYVTGSPIVIENSIVYNPPGTDLSYSEGGSFNVSYSLIGDPGATGVTDGANGNIVGMDPLLGPLADNGGSNQTHALDYNSPAFNAGNPAFVPPPAYDQRGSGFPREVFGRVDMGAYEFQSIPVTLSINPDPANLAEDATNSATISACLPTAVMAFEDVTVNLAVTGTATAGSDHDLSNPDVITITSGNNCGMVTLAATDDSADEPDESVVVDIANISPASYGEETQQQVTATILDDDVPTVSLSLAGSPFAEAGGMATVTATLDQPGQDDVTVDLGFAGSAGAGDYTASAEPITIPAGMTTATLTLTSVDDAVAEGDETVVVNIVSTTNATVGTPDEVSATLADDDVPGITVIPTGGLVTTEAGGMATFTVVLNTQPTADVSIALSSSDSTEGSASPASLTFTQVNWNQAQTVTVTGVDDSADDGDIAFNVVTAPAASTDPVYTGVDAPDVAVTNQDDDDPVPATVTNVTLSVSNVPEDGGATITATLDQPASQDVTITLGFSGEAQSGADFNVAPNPIVIPAGETSGTAQVTAVDDPDVEGDENFTVTVQAVTGADLASPPPAAAGAVIDNDQAQVSSVPIPALSLLGLLLLPLLLPLAAWRSLRKRAI